ncbi:MAG: hypothetical protein PHD21_04030 [Flavobacteriales bacterium]|nr:hypothetical protein [Flavobacteriales bacterium]
MEMRIDSPLNRLMAEKNEVITTLNNEQKKINTSITFISQNYRSVVLYAVKKLIFPAEKQVKEQTKNAVFSSIKKAFLPLVLDFVIGKIMSFFFRRSHQ